MGRAKRWLPAALALLAGCADSEPRRQRQLAQPARPDAPRTAAVAEPRRPPTAAPLRLSPPLAQRPAAAATATAPPAKQAGSAPHQTAPALGERFAPKDECAALPGFPAFREALVAAVSAREAEGLVRLAATDVRLDFGGGAGRDELRARLAAADSALWGELDALLPLGCAADSGVATMPWIFARMPEGVDPYRAMLVLGGEVPLRRRPAPAAPELDRLDWALVTLVGDAFDPKARFAEVGTGSGARGYVESAALRSLLGYRVIADRVAGAWRITAFVAGD